MSGQFSTRASCSVLFFSFVNFGSPVYNGTLLEHPTSRTTHRRRRPAHTLPLQVLGTAAEWCFAISCYFRLICTTLVFIVLKINLLWSNKIVVVNKFICRTMSVDILARALSIDSGLSRVWSNVGFKLLVYHVHFLCSLVLPLRSARRYMTEQSCQFCRLVLNPTECVADPVNVSNN